MRTLKPPEKRNLGAKVPMVASAGAAGLMSNRMETKMTTYQFRSMLFRNSLEVAAAIAEAYLTACGMNSASDIRGFFAESTDEEMAGENIKGRGLAAIVNDNAERK